MSSRKEHKQMSKSDIKWAIRNYMSYHRGDPDYPIIDEIREYKDNDSEIAEFLNDLVYVLTKTQYREVELSRDLTAVKSSKIFELAIAQARQKLGLSETDLCDTVFASSREANAAFGRIAIPTTYCASSAKLAQRFQQCFQVVNGVIRDLKLAGEWTTYISARIVSTASDQANIPIGNTSSGFSPRVLKASKKSVIIEIPKGTKQEIYNTMWYALKDFLENDIPSELYIGTDMSSRVHADAVLGSRPIDIARTYNPLEPDTPDYERIVHDKQSSDRIQKQLQTKDRKQAQSNFKRTRNKKVG